VVAKSTIAKERMLIHPNRSKSKPTTAKNPKNHPGEKNMDKIAKRQLRESIRKYIAGVKLNVYEQETIKILKDELIHTQTEYKLPKKAGKF
jgi:hypothetical protein